MQFDLIQFCFSPIAVFIVFYQINKKMGKRLKYKSLRLDFTNKKTTSKLDVQLFCQVFGSRRIWTTEKKVSGKLKEVKQHQSAARAATKGFLMTFSHDAKSSAKMKTRQVGWETTVNEFDEGFALK